LIASERVQASNHPQALCAVRGRAGRYGRSTGVRLTRFAALAPKLSGSVDPSTLATGRIRTPYAAARLADRKARARAAHYASKREGANAAK